MRNGEPNIYAGLATLRNGYMQMQWSRVQMFIVFNTIALPLVFGTGQSELVKSVISIVGILIHLLLLSAVLRANGWIKLLDEKLSRLEQLDHDDPNGTRVFIFSDPDFSIKRNKWLASRFIFGIIGTGATVIWIEEAISHYYYTLTHREAHMKPTTPAEMVEWAKEQCRKHERMETILTPIFVVGAFLVVAILWSFPILRMLGKLPQP